MMVTGLALITGCTSVPKTQAVQQKHVYTLDNKCPTELVVGVGETITVILADNPSTGYSWKLRGALQHFDATSSYAAHKTEGYLVVGAGGERNFHFKANSVGTDNINLVYTRSWTPDQIGAQWTCQVTVK